MAQALSSRLKRRVGPLAYPVATVKAFLAHQPFPVQLHFPTGEREPAEYARLLQVSVANGRFFGGGQIAAADSSIDDDALDVTLIRQGSLRALVSVARGLRSGAASAQVESFRTRAVAVHTDRNLPINVDGEVVDRTPQRFSIARNALHVVVPKTWTDAT